MKRSMEELLQKADFTKESNLYGKLKRQLFSARAPGFLDDHRLAEDDLEELAAAGPVGEADLDTKTAPDAKPAGRRC